MLSRPKTGSRDSRWDISATIAQHGSPRIFPDIDTEDSSTSRCRVKFIINIGTNRDQLLICPRAVRLGLQIRAGGQGHLCEDLGHGQAYSVIWY